MELPVEHGSRRRFFLFNT